MVDSSKSQWACPACTFVNQRAVAQCEMCMTARPKSAGTMKRRATTNSMPTSPKAGGSMKEKRSPRKAINKSNGQDEKKKKEEEEKGKKKKEPTIEESLTSDFVDDNDTDKKDEKALKAAKKEEEKERKEKLKKEKQERKEKAKEDKERKKEEKEKERKEHKEEDVAEGDSAAESPSPTAPEKKRERKRSLLGRAFGSSTLKRNSAGGTGGSGGSSPVADAKLKSASDDTLGAVIGGNWKALLQAKRSVLLVVENGSTELLIRRGDPKLLSGTWARPPPAVIASQSEVEFGAFANNVMQGVKGSCKFSTEGSGMFTFTFQNSKVGTPEVKCDYPKGFKVERKGEMGKYAEIRFAISRSGRSERSSSKPEMQEEILVGIDDDQLDEIVGKMVQLPPPKEESEPEASPFDTPLDAKEDSSSSDDDINNDSLTDLQSHNFGAAFEQPDEDRAPKLQLKMVSSEQAEEVKKQAEEILKSHAIALTAPPLSSSESRRRRTTRLVSSSATKDVATVGDTKKDEPKDGSGKTQSDHTTENGNRDEGHGQKQEGLRGSKEKEKERELEKAEQGADTYKQTEVPVQDKDGKVPASPHAGEDKKQVEKVQSPIAHEREKEKEKEHHKEKQVQPPEPRAVASTASVNVAQEASEEMKLASGKLDVGQFQDALPHVDRSLQLLTTDVNTYRAQIKVCAHYKIALHILIQIAEIDKVLKQGVESKEARLTAAYLAKLLSTLRLAGKHNIICIRMAITKNVEAENYGVAAELLRFLLSKNPPDVAGLNAKLGICTQHGEQNSPACVYNAVPCCQQFIPIRGKEYLSCSVCGSTFADNVCKAGASCGICKVGALGKHIS